MPVPTGKHLHPRGCGRYCDNHDILERLPQRSVDISRQNTAQGLNDRLGRVWWPKQSSSILEATPRKNRRTELLDDRGDGLRSNSKGQSDRDDPSYGRAGDQAEDLMAGRSEQFLKSSENERGEIPSKSTTAERQNQRRHTVMPRTGTTNRHLVGSVGSPSVPVSPSNLNSSSSLMSST